MSLSKILSTSNLRILSFSHSFAGGAFEKFTNLYDFSSIKGNYFLIKDFVSYFFTQDVGIIQEVAFDNVGGIANPQTRYSRTIGKVLLQNYLLKFDNQIKIRLQANSNDLGIFTGSSYYQGALEFKDLFVVVPEKLQQDFNLSMSTGTFVDQDGALFFPSVFVKMVGYIINQDQKDSLMPGSINKIELVDTKQIKPSGILKNPQPPDKPEFFYD